MFGVGQDLVQVTQTLPLPAQAGAVSRLLTVFVEGVQAGQYKVGLTDASHVLEVPRNSKITLTLADVDTAKTIGVPVSLTFNAVTTSQLAAPAALSAPVVAEVPAPVRPTVVAGTSSIGRPNI